MTVRSPPPCSWPAVLRHCCSPEVTNLLRKSTPSLGHPPGVSGAEPHVPPRTHTSPPPLPLSARQDLHQRSFETFLCSPFSLTALEKNIKSGLGQQRLSRTLLLCYPGPPHSSIASVASIPSDRRSSNALRAFL
ncbi:hypothetical protein E2C01_075082 [Portunus trituberculatus]|uniref:Uncharacterized protein n=1 Tax=Portunus trituberculatus TaxID=210409 RepID=A0A5B7I9T1_PORTR|nr:hypothetical protein [Portunus trituberculatus]